MSLGWVYADDTGNECDAKDAMLRMRGNRIQVRAIRRFWVPYLKCSIGNWCLSLTLSLRAIECGTRWADFAKARSTYWAVSLHGRTTG